MQPRTVPPTSFRDYGPEVGSRLSLQDDGFMDISFTLAEGAPKDFRDNDCVLVSSVQPTVEDPLSSRLLTSQLAEFRP